MTENATPLPATPAPAEATPPAKKGISLRTKLLLVLVLMPLVTLAFYLLLAIRLFENDKIAYVFDSTAAVTRNLSGQLRARIEGSLREMTLVIRNFDGQKSFNSVANSVFDGNKELLSIQVFHFVKDGKQTKLAELKKEKDKVEFLEEEDFKKQITPILEDALAHGFAVQTLSAHPDLFAFGIKTTGSEKKEGPSTVVLAIYRFEDIASIFLKKDVFSTYLTTESGQIILSPPQKEDTLRGKMTSFTTWDLLAKIVSSKFPTGTVEGNTAGGVRVLVSYSRVGMGQLLILSLVQKSVALRAVDALVVKSLIFFLALASAATIISVISSGRLTGTLKKLSQSTEQVSQGNFNIHVDRTSDDEVGLLADSFNRMAAEVARLIAETASKARMEKELETGKAVQGTLFPKANSEIGPLQVSGFYVPASECGGDWWHYCKVGNKVFLWIGDATGHGVPAALITSAAKSAATILEKLSPMSPSVALKHLNRSIHATAKGEVMMTFFLAALDLTTGTLTYANASHDSPYLLRKRDKDTPIRRKDFLPMNDVVNPRLGENPNSEYQEATVQLEDGDMLIFYTDGVYDVMNPDTQTALGEKGFLNLVAESHGGAGSATDFVSGVQTRMVEYRKNSDLIDDITFFGCHYKQPEPPAA